MKKKLELAMALSLLVASFFLAKKGATLVLSENTKPDPHCIVIDAGHGGIDPGKIGINDAKEKDINLSIALKLSALLKKENIKVVLTREDDNGLYSESSTNKKVEDMQNRCKLITDTNPIFTISIHQNSYPTEDIKGAQVFYYGQSADGEALAKKIQSSLIENLDPENKREAKANESYYLLKKTPTPTVIVECGFLSNSTEADLLCTSDYQDKVANAILLGIQSYLNPKASSDTETILESETSSDTETILESETSSNTETILESGTSSLD